MANPGFLRLRRPRVLAAFVGVTVLLALFLGLVATDLNAQGETDPILGCASSNGLRLVDDLGECRPNEEPVQWNEQGPQGPEGPQGPAGPPGETDVTVNVVDDGQATASITGFLKLGEIEGGEADEARFEGWSRLIDIEQSMSLPFVPGTGGGGGAGNPQFEAIKVTKVMDRASPLLAQALATGMTAQTAEIALVDESADGRPQFLNITLEDVLVVGVDWAGSSNPNISQPIETVSLAYREATMNYTPLDAAPGGNVTSSWSVVSP